MGLTARGSLPPWQEHPPARTLVQSAREHWWLGMRSLLGALLNFRRAEMLLLTRIPSHEKYDRICRSEQALILHYGQRAQALVKHIKSIQTMFTAELDLHEWEDNPRAFDSDPVIDDQQRSEANSAQIMDGNLLKMRDIPKVDRPSLSVAMPARVRRLSNQKAILRKASDNTLGSVPRVNHNGSPLRGPIPPLRRDSPPTLPGTPRIFIKPKEEGSSSLSLPACTLQNTVTSPLHPALAHRRSRTASLRSRGSPRVWGEPPPPILSMPPPPTIPASCRSHPSRSSISVSSRSRGRSTPPISLPGTGWTTGEEGWDRGYQESLSDSIPPSHRSDRTPLSPIYSDAEPG